MTSGTPIADEQQQQVECCGNCLCYLPLTPEGGTCHRGPPSVVVLMVPERTPGGKAVLIGADNGKPRMVPQAQGQWPPVPANGWCYDHVDPVEAGAEP